MVDVKNFGATGDGLLAETAVIQNALDTGKIVHFPTGVYRTGTLYLRSGGGIHLDPDAIILGSTDPADYNANDFDPRNTFSIKEKAAGNAYSKKTINSKMTNRINDLKDLDNYMIETTDKTIEKGVIPATSNIIEDELR